MSKNGTGISRKSFPFRNHFTYSSLEEDDPLHCACCQSVGQSYEFCLDRSCVRPPECMFNVFEIPSLFLSVEEQEEKRPSCTYRTTFEPTRLTQCKNEEVCNWSSELNENHCLDDSFSEGLCGVPRFFSWETYRPVDLSEEECGEGVCVTPWGAIVPPSETEQSLNCSELGVCTTLCPSEEPSCVPSDPFLPSVCYLPSMSKIECEVGWGKWMGHSGDDTAYCVFPTMNFESVCIGSGKEFMECAALSQSECPFAPLDICFFGNWKVCSQEECQEGADEDEEMGICGNPENTGYCVAPFVSAETDRLICYALTTVSQLGYFFLFCFFFSLSHLILFFLQDV